MQNPILLGVNIDHVATLRQARGTFYPDTVEAVSIVEKAGGDSITVHLREDRRHIQDSDVERIKAMMATPMNLEMAVTEEMLRFAEKIKPQHCCLVPEKREELTTEGGLDVLGQKARIRDACQRLTALGIEASLFIDPEEAQLEAALDCQAPVIEIHTGHYANALDKKTQESELKRIQKAALWAHKAGLIVNAGHGLNIANIKPIAAISELVTLNIGHAIIARAVFSGLAEAVREMKEMMRDARVNLKNA